MHKSLSNPKINLHNITNSFCDAESFAFKEEELSGTHGYFLVREYEVFSVHLH